MSLRPRLISRPPIKRCFVGFFILFALVFMVFINLFVDVDVDDFVVDDVDVDVVNVVVVNVVVVNVVVVVFIDVVFEFDCVFSIILLFHFAVVEFRYRIFNAFLWGNI